MKKRIDIRIEDEEQDETKYQRIIREKSKTERVYRNIKSAWLSHSNDFEDIDAFYA